MFYFQQKTNKLYFQIVLLVRLATSDAYKDFLNIGPVLTYARNLVFGRPNMYDVVPMVFDPEQSARLAPLYQKTYGYRGRNLIHAFGIGYSRKDLIRFGAVSQ